MSAAAIIQKAREDGLSLAVTERDTIKVIGPRVAANRRAPELVANKPAILAALAKPVPRLGPRSALSARSRSVWITFLSATRPLGDRCYPSVLPWLGLSCGKPRTMTPRSCSVTSAACLANTNGRLAISSTCRMTANRAGSYGSSRAAELGHVGAQLAVQQLQQQREFQFKGSTVWEGVVHVFDLERPFQGHARLCVVIAD